MSVGIQRSDFLFSLFNIVRFLIRCAGFIIIIVIVHVESDSSFVSSLSGHEYDMITG